MSNQFITQAAAKVTQAINADSAGEYEKALPLYRLSLEYFMTGLKYEKSGAMKEKIMDKVTGYLKRAEFLKDMLESKQKPSDSGVAVTSTVSKSKDDKRGYDIAAEAKRQQLLAEQQQRQKKRQEEEGATAEAKRQQLIAEQQYYELVQEVFNEEEETRVKAVAGVATTDLTVALKSDYEATLLAMSRDLLRVKEVQQQLSSNQHDANAVQRLQAQVDAIDNKYKSSPLDRAEKDHIAGTPELKQYYELVQKVFNEAFLVSSAISTGMIEVQQQSAGQVFSVLSTLTQGIPFVPGVLSFIEGRVDSLLGARQDGRYGFLSNLNPTSNAFDAALYAERVARHVTITLEDSIKTIQEKKNPFEFKAIKKFMKLLETQVNKVDKGLAAGLFGEESALELLAYKHTKAGLEYVMSGHLEGTNAEEGLHELVGHMTGCMLTRLPLSTATTQPDTFMNTSVFRVAVTTANDKQSQQSSDVSGSVHWIAEALEHKTGLTQQHIMLYEDILTRNAIHSKEELASLTDEEFRDNVVIRHVGELQPIGVKKSFEALHAVCRSEAIRPSKVASTEHVTFEQHDAVKQQIAEMQQQLEDRPQLDPSDVASAKQMKRLQQELADTKRTLHSVFQSSFVDDGNRVQEAVATREGATLRVVNPQADEQFQVLQGAVMQLQESVEAMQREMETKFSASNKSQKKQK